MTHLTPLQQYCQEKFILAAHPGCSIEEAKTIELRSRPGCKVVRRKNGYTTVLATVISVRYDMKFAYIQPYNRRDYGPVKINVKDIEQIIGLPPTLSRVLTALGEDFHWESENLEVYINPRTEDQLKQCVCKRKLLNDDGTDATLFDQCEETVSDIALILGRKDE